MIDGHAEKSPCRDERIHFTESSLPDAVANIFRQDLKALRDSCLKKSVGEFVVLKPAEQEQPEKFGIFGVALENVFGDLGELGQLVGVRIKHLPQAGHGAANVALLLDHRPIKVFFGRKMAKDDGFSHARALRDLARSGALIALRSKKLERGRDQMLATERSGQTHGK